MSEETMRTTTTEGNAPRKQMPADDLILRAFCTLPASSLPAFNRDCGLALTGKMFAYLQRCCREVLRRPPLVGELRVADALSRMPREGYIGGRHTMDELYTESPVIAETWSDMMQKHALLSRTEGESLPLPCTWEDALTLTTRYLRRMPYGHTQTTGKKTVHRAVTLSSARTYEAIVEGWTVEARMVLESGERAAVISRTGNAPEEAPARARDVILYAPAVPEAILSAFLHHYRTTSPGAIGAVRVVTRKSLLMTLSEMADGICVFTYNLLSESERMGKTRLPVEALCALPTEQKGGTVPLLVRTSLSNAKAMVGELRKRGLTAMALGQVISQKGLSLCIREARGGTVADRVAVNLSADFLHSMEAMQGHTCRPTIEDRPVAVTPAAVFPLPLPVPPVTEEGITPAGWETVAMVTAKEAPAALSAGGVGLSAATVTVSARGAGFEAARTTIRTVTETMGQGCTLSVSVQVWGVPGDVTAEVVCGFYRAAAEGGLPVEGSDFLTHDAEGETVRLTVVAWTPAPSGDPAAPAGWGTTTETSEAPIDGQTYVFPILHRSMEGSLHALMRAMQQARPVRTLLQPMAMERPDTLYAAIHARSSEKMVELLKGDCVPVFAMSEADARLFLEDEDIRKALDHNLQRGGRVVVLGPAVCVFAAYGYLEDTLGVVTEIPLARVSDVTYGGLSSSPVARRLSRGILLAPAKMPTAHLLTYALADGRLVPDGFVGQDGAVLGLLNGVDPTLVPFLMEPRFPLSGCGVTPPLGSVPSMKIPAFEPLSKHPRAVLLDTDIGPDCDDVGALVTLIHYAKTYGFPIAGVCNCTSNRAGNGAIDAVFAHCGMETPPLGQWPHPDFLDTPECHLYNDTIAERFSAAYREGTLSVEDAVPFYRRRLAALPDGEAMVVTIGMFNNLAALLESPADEISPMTGKELVKTKVYALVSMAATLPEGREYNVVCDAPAARAVFENWPTPIYLSDATLGVSIRSGYSRITDPAAIEASPLPLAYHLYTRDREGFAARENASYDLTAVQFAALGEGDLYGLGERGRLAFYAELPDREDATRFIPDPHGSCRFMTKRASDDTIAALLNEILLGY